MSEATRKLQLLGQLGVNSDYSQNDETKKDYIKNRPFYVDDDGKVHPIDAKYLPDNMYARLVAAEKDIVDLKYEPIAISNFTNSVGSVEIGSTVTDIKFTWTLNKSAKRVTLTPENSITIDQTTGTAGVSTWTKQSLTQNKKYTLTATDERDHSVSATTSIAFFNGVYYGVSAKTETLDSEFVLSLTRTLRSSKLTSFSVNTSEGQYIYYCLPVRYGTCSFTVGGFTGGFTLVDTIEFTNASGYTEKYYIYKSDNANLGSAKITVE